MKPGFEIAAGASIRVTDDVPAALDAMKPGLGFYIGGMGSPSWCWARNKKPV